MDRSLSDRMRALDHPRSAELREHADKLDAATAGFYGDPQTVDVRQFMGAWARARKLWCSVTGESLL